MAELIPLVSVLPYSGLTRMVESWGSRFDDVLDIASEAAMNERLTACVNYQNYHAARKRRLEGLRD